MTRHISVKGVFIHANATPCANHCRYCQLATSRPKPVSVDRYAALIHRFLDWRESHQSEFEIWPWFGNSYDTDEYTVVALRNIEERMGGLCGNVLLGGLAHRSPEEMQRWLQFRQQQGKHTLVATFSGYAEQHDYWNNLQGNYSFQLESLRLAARQGMKLQQRILLLRSSLPGLTRLLDDLDSVAVAEYDRWAIPLFYSGQARRIERERLTEGDFAALPDRVRALLRSDKDNWRAEYRWAEYAMQNDEGVVDMCLPLRINEQTLSWAEKLSCDEIVHELTMRAHKAYLHMPTRRELCQKYADLKNDKVYFNIEQMERKWIEHYLQDNPDAFDLSATRFG